MVLLTGFSILLSACGGGGSGSSGDVQAPVTTSSGVTLRLTDAKVNSLQEVWITFTKVIFHSTDGKRVEHTFDPPRKVELTQLAGGGEVFIDLNGNYKKGTSVDNRRSPFTFHYV